jgi:hypothetical protein
MSALASRDNDKTDIVERLRAADISGYGTYSALVREAADEIERLRRLLEMSYPEQHAEIERLREALHFYAYDGNWNSSEMKGDGGDIARQALNHTDT